MWEFIKGIVTIYVGIFTFFLNFFISAGFMKFYFDKKLATQKEEADKKIAELNGIISRGNYAHGIIIQTKITLYEELWKNISNFTVFCIEIDSFCKKNEIKDKLPELLKGSYNEFDISEKLMEEINSKFKKLDTEGFSTMKLLQEKLIFIDEKEQFYKFCISFINDFINPIHSDFTVYFHKNEDMNKKLGEIEDELRMILNETMKI